MGRRGAISTVTAKRNIALKRPNPPGERIARRQGGLKGGKARGEKLSPERRREIALRATRARWAMVTKRAKAPTSTLPP